jgi:hypothetical protein
MGQFRQYISQVFAEQLSGTVNEVRGDKGSSRKKVLDDLSSWPALRRKFDGEGIGSDIRQLNGTAWSAYQAVTEYITHEAGRSRNPDEATRMRFESLYWGKGSEIIHKAHAIASAMN